MKPLLTIGPLTHLQDARSSAAVGFDIISFSLERGSVKKLPASSIWSIVNWLSGPEILIQLNLDSLEELAQVQQTFPVGMVSLPAADWDIRLASELPPKVILKADASHSIGLLTQWLEEADDANLELFIELHLEREGEADLYSSILSKSLLHFPDLDMTQSFAASSAMQPYGFAIGEEAEEEPNQLDYERIDDFLEIFEARYS